jgi:quercetin dioxygenase-like cupin family protein
VKNGIKVSRPAASFVDDRGQIIDLLENEEVNAVTLITFKKGAVRANHFHKLTSQWNYVVSGEIKVVTQSEGEAPVETILKAGEMLLTEPNVRHALKAMQDSELMVFTKGPRGGKEYETDTYRLKEPLIR